MAWLRPHGVRLTDEMLIKLFVLHNEPVSHSLFLVNFKQAGMSEFVLILHTPRLLSLSDFILIFSKLELFLFFSFHHIFLKDTNLHKMFLKVEQTRKAPKFWFISEYLFIEFSKVDLFSVSQTGDFISIYLER